MPFETIVSFLEFPFWKRIHRRCKIHFIDLILYSSRWDWTMVISDYVLFSFHSASRATNIDISLPLEKRFNVTDLKEKYPHISFFRFFYYFICKYNHFRVFCYLKKKITKKKVFKSFSSCCSNVISSRRYTKKQKNQNNTFYSKISNILKWQFIYALWWWCVW